MISSLKTVADHSLLLLFVILSASLTAQRYTEIGSFVSIPTGDFAARNLDGGSFAEVGWGLNISSRIEVPNVYRRFGIYLQGSWQRNRMNTAALSEEFTRAIGYRTLVSESRYMPVTALIGPSHQLFSGRIQVFLNAGIGVIFNNTRALTLTILDDNGNVDYEEVVSFVNNPAFVYMLGFDLSTEVIPDRLKVSLFAQYSTARQEVDIYLSTNQNAGAFEQIGFINTGFKFTLNTFR